MPPAIFYSCWQRATQLAVAYLLLLLLLSFSSIIAAAPVRVGYDLPLHWYQDPGAQLRLEEFVHLPESALKSHKGILSIGYTRDALWLRTRIPAELFRQSEQWVQLGPAFIDHLTAYYRPSGSGQEWIRQEMGDLVPGQRGDLDYRFPVLILPPPPTHSEGYELVIRVQSTSAVLAEITLWSPDEFTQQAARQTAFWSFYFGLAAVSGGLAFLLAFLIRSRLLWSVSIFSLSYLLTACIQGYVDWVFGTAFIHLQHYLTSVFTLLAYSSILWMSCEALNFREHLPRLYTFMVWFVAFNLLLQLSIPLDLYGPAIQLQTLIILLTIPIFTAGAARLWWQEGFNIITLLISTVPLLHVASAMIALLSLHGLIPYYPWLYGTWQYILLGNMFLVLTLSVLRIRDENRQNLEKKQLARELCIEREASFHQRQFIGMVSHEFRTPLAVISGALENLRITTLSASQRSQRYDKIERAAGRMVQLTDNCLADARLSTSQMYLDKKPNELLKLIREASVVVDLSDEHALLITLNGKPLSETPIDEVLLNADSGLLRIALSNLFDNAVKYTPEGIIQVDIRQGDPQCLICISDDGPGIPETMMNEVFERYRRLEAQYSHHRGAGLGLFVARQIARAHSGDLWLEKNHRKGCHFVLSLPYDVTLVDEISLTS